MIIKRRIIDIKRSFDVKDEDVLSRCVEFVENTLKSLGTNKKLIMRSILVAEEASSLLIDHAGSDSVLKVRIKRFLGDTLIVISCSGEAFEPFLKPDESISFTDVGDDDVQATIRSLLLKSQGELLRFSRRNNINTVRILTGENGKSMILRTITALAFGIVAGILLKFLFPGVVASAVNEYALTPVRTIFMNALKIVIAPVVFFSIVSCVSQFKDLSELGRLGAKVMGMYMLTTLMAVALAIGVSYSLSPGQYGSLAGIAVSGADEELASQSSVKDMIINIVPSNFVKPFLESDTLQIIFLAVLCGVAVASMKEYASFLHDIFDALNSLFLTITGIIAGFIPYAAFCAVTIIIIEVEISSLLSIFSVIGTFLLCIFLMLCVYGSLILVLTRLNPFTFYKKVKEGMLTSLALSSSSAAMPTNLRVCIEKLGISPKICTFSIPLGATVNMDGGCIVVTVSSLFLAKCYGLEISPSLLITFIITVIVLSLGAPGVPGAGIVCIGIALQSLNLPVELLGIVIGIYPLMDMFSTMSNTTGDIAATLIVAKSEGLIDLAEFNRSEK